MKLPGRIILPVSQCMCSTDLIRSLQPHGAISPVTGYDDRLLVPSAFHLEPLKAFSKMGLNLGVTDKHMKHFGVQHLD